MPRKACIDLCSVDSAKMYASGALHHIIHGIERKAIFKDNNEKSKFCQ